MFVNGIEKRRAVGVIRVVPKHYNNRDLETNRKGNFVVQKLGTYYKLE